MNSTICYSNVRGKWNQMKLENNSDVFVSNHLVFKRIIIVNIVPSIIEVMIKVWVKLNIRLNGNILTSSKNIKVCD